MYRAKPSDASVSCFLVALIMLMGWLTTASASSITLDEEEVFGATRWGVIPYAFATETLGTALGVTAFVSGVNQPQSNLVGTLYKTSNDSWLAAGALNNFRFDALDRGFIELFAMRSYFTTRRRSITQQRHV